MTVKDKDMQTWIKATIVTSAIAFVSWLTTTTINAQTDASIASVKINDLDNRLDRIETKLDGVLVSLRDNKNY